MRTRNWFSHWVCYQIKLKCPLSRIHQWSENKFNLGPPIKTHLVPLAIVLGKPRIYPTALCLLETYTGNIIVWKHHLHLETKNVDWKHTNSIGNIFCILETYELDWKHILHIGNITPTLTSPWPLFHPDPKVNLTLISLLP